MWKIIKMGRKNIEELAEIDSEAEHQIGKKRKVKVSDYKKELTERFNKNQEIFFGFMEDNMIKGYVSLKPFFPGYKHCEVYWLSVRKKYQNRGIGTKLMNFIEKYTKKKGFRKVCLYTNKIMKKTRSFYENLGYKKVNEFPGYYGYSKNNTAVLYAKNI